MEPAPADPLNALLPMSYALLLLPLSYALVLLPLSYALLLLLPPFSAAGWEAAEVGLNDFTLLTSTARAPLLLPPLLPLAIATAAVADDAARLKSSSADNTRELRPMTRVATAPSRDCGRTSLLLPLLETASLGMDGRGALRDCHATQQQSHATRTCTHCHVPHTCKSAPHPCCCCSHATAL